MFSRDEDIELFRMTHIENIPHILKYGITHKNSKQANPNYTNIGDVALIEKREKTEVKITNGQDNVTYSITLGDFIPFYFGVKMPMLYAIQYGVNLAEKVHASEIIYLVCSVKKILNLQVEYCLSDGHAINVLTSFYDYNCINQIDTILDWEAIHANLLGWRRKS